MTKEAITLQSELHEINRQIQSSIRCGQFGQVAIEATALAQKSRQLNLAILQDPEPMPGESAEEAKQRANAHL